MADNEPLPGILQLTPLNPAFRDDPHGMLRRLREEAPVHRDDMAGSFMVSRFKDVRAVLNDRTLWRRPDRAEPGAYLTRRLIDAFTADPQTGELRPSTILLMDDPDHARVRGPFTQALYARAGKCKPQVEAIVDEALAQISPGDRFELMSAFAIPIPINVIASLLGVDPARRDEFRDWSEGLIQILNPLRTPEQEQHRQRALETTREHIFGLMMDRRANPRDDLVSDMMRLQREGAPLSDDEIGSNLTGLLVAGNLITSDLIGNGVYLLLTHPEELAKLRADPTIINSVVEEILRYAAPTEITARVASRDMEIGGCPVHKTQSIITLLRGANRDPEVFEAPEQFNVTRRPGPHVAFGGGSHICIGAPLARLEAQVAISRLFQRFPNLALAQPNEAPTKRTLPFFNGYERLELTA